MAKTTLELDDEGLGRRRDWEAAGIRLPSFDRPSMLRATGARPRWVHLGCGNIFRAFPARLAQTLLDEGLSESGVVAAEPFDFEIVDRIYGPHDGLALVVGLEPSGALDARVVASVARAIAAEGRLGFERLAAIFESPELQMASLTVTEKGYALADLRGEPTRAAAADMAAGPGPSAHAMGLVASLLHRRYRAGAAPIALVSMDNCSRNGERLRGALLAMAGAWVAAGLAESGFVAYLEDEGRVGFPWTMIDKIVPRPSAAVAARLAELGVAGMETIVTSRGTHIAPFVNCEIPEYLVVEERFPNGRPALERAGVLFGDREAVGLAERMKVTACLNPLHTALAVFGCLLGYTSIADEMADPELSALVRRLGREEGLPALPAGCPLDPGLFLDEVLERRLPNPHIPDTPQRIASDTSQKVAIRFGETVRAHAARGPEGTAGLVCVPLAIAGWLRYLLGTDDRLAPMELSPDPLLGELRASLAGSGGPDGAAARLKPLLSNRALFGVDLLEAGMAERIVGMFARMSAGQGAVRATLREYLGG